MRRSETDRVAAGLAGGMGEYFGVDPVIFRVLFATTAFFGGAGILAYLIAWAVIPERSQVNAPIDRFVAGMRRRKVPLWVAAVGAVLVVWIVLSSWWVPWHAFPWMFFPLLLAAVILAVALSRRPAQPIAPQAPQAQPTQATQPMPAYGPPPGFTGPQPATGEFRSWISEARQAARERRRRSAPVRWGTLGGLAAVLVVLAALDVAWGVAIPVYFWAVLLIVTAGLVVGAVMRRPVWWISVLLVPAAIGAFVFAGCRASLHDGSGDNTYTPVNAAALHTNYRQAFGRLQLDLSQVTALDAPQTIHVRQAAGQVRLLVPRSLAIIVHAKVHLGDVTIDGRTDSGGMSLRSDLVTPGPGSPLTIDVNINAGELRIEHVS
ncbi:MAG TPA: PspC domain-containing protein [Kribbellaceae bacterium]|nr:PspC domain-containing protein [Kribbellaceae bacterium]